MQALGTTIRWLCVMFDNYSAQQNITDWVSVKETNWGSEHRSKHPVVEHTRGIDTHKVDKNGSHEAEQNGRC